MQDTQAHPERRSHPRYSVDEEAMLVLVNAGATIPGRMFEISLDGCRVRPAKPYLIAAPIGIEVLFRINGIAFRLAGVLQWIDQEQAAGIQFSSMAPRRREAIEELLAELEAKEQSSAAASNAANTDPNPSANPPPVQPPASPTYGKHRSVAGPPVRNGHTSETALPSPPSPQNRSARLPEPHVRAEEPKPAAAPPAPTPGRERRHETRHAVDTQATVFLIDVRAQISGRILDVSMSGCRIRTDERFPVGIYRRVETEFKVDGLPFRLGGVVQALHDKFTVGIRFLDMSHRKRDQLGQLMEEITMTRAAQRG